MGSTRREQDNQAPLLPPGSERGSINAAQPAAQGKRAPKFWALWLGFFLLGTVNNLPYVIVASAAKTISGHYCKLNLIGAVTWANVAFGFFAKGLNGAFLLDTSYAGRLWCMVVVMSAGLVIVAMSDSFTIAIVGIVLAGAACSFGEGVALGYLGQFDNMLVNAWSSGTGLAGVGGSLLYLGYIAAGFDFRKTFLFTIPWMGLYLVAFHCLILPNQPSAKEGRTKKVDSAVAGRSAAAPTTGTESGWSRFKRCLSYCRWVTANLCFVYVFEYVISAGLAAKALPATEGCTFTSEHACGVGGCLWANISDSGQQCAGSTVTGSCKSDDFTAANSYAIFGFCYQAGVLISRSSLQVIRINRVELLTAGQAVNFVIWTLQAYYKTVSSLELLFALMFTVGLFGGASYVNVFHVLLVDPAIPERDREFTIQIAAVFGPTLGITLSSLLIMAMDNTFLENA